LNIREDKRFFLGCPTRLCFIYEEAFGVAFLALPYYILCEDAKSKTYKDRWQIELFFKALEQNL
jgi:hypothetical protein